MTIELHCKICGKNIGSEWANICYKCESDIRIQKERDTRAEKELAILEREKARDMRRLYS